MGIDDSMNKRWDEEFDVIVVGSGAGGMTAALCAQAHGLSAVVIEKDALFGGTSAVSGGSSTSPRGRIRCLSIACRSSRCWSN